MDQSKYLFTGITPLNNRTIMDFSSDSKHFLQIPTYLWVGLLAAYPLLCTLLRHQRLHSTIKKYPYTTRESLAGMTQLDAWEIQQRMAELEFPFTYQKSLQFALFKTYGIPSISKLLVNTGLLSSAKTSSKRYTDTVVLIADFMSYPPGSARAAEAIARMNFLHSGYLKTGQISNNDMLYTLSLFALEPIRWIERWEWRRLHMAEKCCAATFWKEVGDAMRIDYSPLKSGGKSSDGESTGAWTDGLHWLEEVEEWAEGYEKESMVPHIDNHKTAEETTALLLWHVPKWAKAMGLKVVCVLMNDRLRTAMMYDRPAQGYYTFTHALLGLRRFVLRYLTLPRPSWLPVHRTTTDPSVEGNFYMNSYDAAPWYVKPTLWNRYGPFAWLSRLVGTPLPGDQGDAFRPGGYKLNDIGPNALRGKGVGWIEREVEVIGHMRSRGGGCPFARVKVE